MKPIRLATALLALGALASSPARADDVTYLGWSQTEPGSKPVLEKMFDAFKASHPGVKFDIVGVPFGQMQTTLVLRRRSGQPLSVAQMQERWLPTYATLGGMVDPNTVLGKDFIDSTYIPSATAMGKVRGKQVGVPWVFGTTGMVANGKVLADAGITEMPTTIEAFIAALRKIKQANPNSSPYGFSTKDPSLAQLEAEMIFWQFGAKLFDDDGNTLVDSPEARRALTFLTDLVKEGLILPGNDRFDIRRLYAQNLVGFYIDAPVARAFARGQSALGNDVDKYVLPIAMPVVKVGDAPVAIQWAHLLVMYDDHGTPPGSDSGAAQLVKFLTLPENQITYFREAGVFPTTNAALAQLKDDPYLTKWVSLSSGARPEECANFANATDLSRIMGEEVIAAMLGQKTPDAAITAMAARFRAAKPHR